MRPDQQLKIQNPSAIPVEHIARVGRRRRSRVRSRNESAAAARASARIVGTLQSEHDEIA
jgi:hypothetical protein